MGRKAFSQQAIINRIAEHLRKQNDNPVHLQKISFKLGVSVSYIRQNITQIFNEQIKDWRYKDGYFYFNPPKEAKKQ